MRVCNEMEMEIWTVLHYVADSYQISKVPTVIYSIHVSIDQLVRV